MYGYLQGVLKLVYNVRGDVLGFEGEAFCLRPAGVGLDVYCYASLRAAPERVARFASGGLADREGRLMEPHRFQVIDLVREDDHDRLYAGFLERDEALNVEYQDMFLQPAPRRGAGPALISLRSPSFHTGISYDPESGRWSDIEGEEGEALYLYGKEWALKPGCAPLFPTLDLALLDSTRGRLSALAS